MRGMLVWGGVWLGLAVPVWPEAVPWLPEPGVYAFASGRPFPPERDPDLVLEAAGEFVLPAQGGPVIRTFVLPCAALAQPVWVEAVHLMPGGDGVVRQAEIRMDSTGQSQERDARDALPGFAGRPHYDSVRQPMELFAGWAPWGPVQLAPEGAGWRLHPQADLVVTCYLEPAGQEARVRPKVGLWFQREAPARQILTLRLANETLSLRPGTADASVRDRFDLPVTARLHAVYPAANRIASTFRLDVLGPRVRDAKGELTPVEAKRVLEIPEWRPYAQEMYRYQEAVELEAGTRLELQIRHDHALTGAANLQPVDWGPRETDEWGEVYVQLTVEGELEALRLGSAISQHQMALSIEGQESRGENDLEAHLALAVMYADLGEYETATAHAEKAVTMAPEDGRTHAALGAVHVSQGFFFTAQEQLETAVKRSPEDSFAWYNLGNVFYHFGVIDKAREAFQKAESLNPRDYRAANNLGIILLGDGKPEQARIRFERILRAQPCQAPALANLARTYEQLGLKEEAVRFYERAIELSPAMKDALTPFLAPLKSQP